MVFVLITSIINAQTFDLGCETTVGSAAEELAALFAQSDHRPDDLNDYPLTAGEVNNLGTQGSFIVYASNSISINDADVRLIYSNGNFNFTYNGETYTVINDATDVSGYPALFLELLQAKFDLLYPNGPPPPPPSELTPAELAALRASRIAELKGLAHSDVTVSVGSADSSDAFTVDGDAAVGNPQTFSTITYGDNKVENLLSNKYDELKADITAKVTELIPFYLKELNALLSDKANVPFPDYDANNNYDYGNAVTTSTFGAPANLVSYILNIPKGQPQIDFILSLGDNVNITGNNVVDAVQDCNVCTTYSRTDDDDTTYDTFQVYFSRWEYYTGYSGTNTITDLPSYGWLRYAIDSIYARWYVTSDGATYNARKAWMDAYADANPNKLCTCSWRAGEDTSTGVTRYKAQWEHYVWQYITGQDWLSVDKFQTGAISLEDLTTANWIKTRDLWKERVDPLQ